MAISKDLIIDPCTLDLNHVIADIEEIRRYNPQRYEMEQVTAIVHIDPAKNICVAYKDITESEFWIRGHMPGMPLMPGVVMCEAAAQVCCYYTSKFQLLGEGTIIGFGGIEEVRFRDPVRVGDRLVLACELLKLRRGMLVIARFQGFVRNSLVVEGKILGIPLPVDALKGSSESSG